jgi:hypothetical protein
MCVQALIGREKGKGEEVDISLGPSILPSCPLLAAARTPTNALFGPYRFTGKTIRSCLLLVWTSSKQAVKSGVPFPLTQALQRQQADSFTAPTSPATSRDGRQQNNTYNTLGGGGGTSVTHGGWTGLDSVTGH